MFHQSWHFLELPLRYESVGKVVVKGSGQTCAMSSKAVRFGADLDLPVGYLVRAVISWPAHLDDGTGLSLWIYGAIEGSGAGVIDVRISRHEFRTRRISQVGVCSEWRSAAR